MSIGWVDSELLSYQRNMQKQIMIRGPISPVYDFPRNKKFFYDFMNIHKKIGNRQTSILEGS